MFTMEHRFNKHEKRDSAQHFMIPFERYGFHAFAFAIDPTTNNSVQIAMFGVFDTLGDFVIRSHDAPNVEKITYESGGELVTMEVESHVLRGEIQRSVIAKASAICLFLGNWAMTVSSVYTTVLIASGRLEANSVVAALPPSALLAIPTIRTLYGSLSLGNSIGKPYTHPPFERILQSDIVPLDAVAFFIQTVTIGLCCLALLRVLTRCRVPNPV